MGELEDLTRFGLWHPIVTRSAAGDRQRDGSVVRELHAAGKRPIRVAWKGPKMVRGDGGRGISVAWWRNQAEEMQTCPLS